MMKELEKEYIEIYGKKPSKIYFAPGRVNIIGEHIDYNGGLVLPCALSCGTYMLVSEREDDLVFFASTNFEYKDFVEIKNLKDSYDDWIKYPVGVIKQIRTKHTDLKGMNILYSGNIPNGAGLSSSASLEVVTAYAINDINKCSYSKIDLALLSQKAENENVGVNCGIMDQFAVAMGKQEKALLLNCDTLDYKEIDACLGDYKFVISNTNKSRKLVDSKYNERRAECDEALKIISTKKKISYLCELSSEDLTELKPLFTQENIWKRLSHVVEENERVISSSQALTSEDLPRLGALMNASHDSLRDKYEVTGLELDTLVEEARKIQGVLGSRMTGAGFGGCTVSIVHKDNIEEFIEKVGEQYYKKTNIKADFYIAEISDGVKQL